MSLKDIPWKTLRAIYYASKRVLFVRRGFEPNIVVEGVSIDDLTDVFRQAHFGNARLFSYHYIGEDVNICRPFLRYDEFMYYRTHIRMKGISSNDGNVVLIDCHDGLDPEENGLAKPHLKGVNQQTESAIDKVSRILDGKEIDHKVNRPVTPQQNGVEL